MCKYRIGGIYRYTTKEGSFRIYQVYSIDGSMVKYNVLNGNIVDCFDIEIEPTGTSSWFMLGSLKDIKSKEYIDLNKELENI